MIISKKTNVHTALTLGKELIHICVVARSLEINTSGR